MRVALAAVGGAASALLLLGALVVINAGEGFSRCTAANGIGWTVPIIAGLSTGAVAWLLLTGRASDEDAPGDGSLVLRDCPACGERVADAWRLCPHCGEDLEHHRSC